MNGIGNLTRRVIMDIGTMAEYKYAKEEMDLSKESIGKMRRGEPVSLWIVQRFADRLEIPAPLVFTDPFSEIDAKADLAYIPGNIERMRQERDMTIQELASATGVMSAGKLEKIESSVILATTVDVQAIADAMEIDILDLMMPPDTDCETQITHKDFLAFNARYQVNSVKLRNGSFEIDNENLFRITRGLDTVRVSAVEKLAMETKIGIAELLTKPGLETEWYKETRADYLADNLKTEMTERNLSNEKLSRMTGVSTNTVANMKNGRNPTVKTAQRIADALEMEIGDLFLPPEG